MYLHTTDFPFVTALCYLYGQRLILVASRFQDLYRLVGLELLLQ